MGGSCCRLGYNDGNGCTGSDGCQNRHCCTKSGLQHELLNQGETCWEECNKIGGNCTWCGDLGSCCRVGYNDGNGCTGSNGCQNRHCCTKSGLRHELLNQGKTCWEECNEIGGNCTWCGDLGSCCRLGYNDRNGCTGSNGCQNRHCCTESGLRHELLNQGQFCWKECNEIGGNCNWCGDLGSCCKLGRKGKMENGKWKMENGCTGFNGCQNKHCCTKSGLQHELLNQGQECWEECNKIG